MSLLDHFSLRHRSNAVGAVGLIWLLGWVWMMGALALGSVREGFGFLRAWLGYVFGMLVMVAPIALFPHPVTVVIGVVGGVAVGTWVASGKAYWLHKE
ncbi:MAG: hypothetical protein INF97_05115 [Roseomonas sp.]|nr:hypothetical protein [Roseomonas sp.]